jgi:Ca2+-binding EF-hand superfamily protein
MNSYAHLGKSNEWIYAMQAKIREAFDLFDKDHQDAVINEEVGTMMRYLGIFPTEKDLIMKYLPEMQDDEPTGFVRYDKLEKRLMELLASGECEPDSREVLLQAFRTIDTDNSGLINADVLETLIAGKGTSFCLSISHN